MEQESTPDIVSQARWYIETATGLQRNWYSFDLIEGLLAEVDRLRPTDAERVAMTAQLDGHMVNQTAVAAIRGMFERLTSRELPKSCETAQ